MYNKLPGWVFSKFLMNWCTRSGERTVLQKVVNFPIKSILAHRHRLQRVIDNGGAHIELEFSADWYWYFLTCFRNWNISKIMWENRKLFALSYAENWPLFVERSVLRNACINSSKILKTLSPEFVVHNPKLSANSVILSFRTSRFSHGLDSWDTLYITWFNIWRYWDEKDNCKGSNISHWAFIFSITL